MRRNKEKLCEIDTVLSSVPPSYYTIKLFTSHEEQYLRFVADLPLKGHFRAEVREGFDQLPLRVRVRRGQNEDHVRQESEQLLAPPHIRYLRKTKKRGIYVMISVSKY